MSDDTTPSRASLASVDARVARLETAQAETDAKIGLIQLEQQHTRELMTSRFNAVETAINSNAAKQDAFMARMEGLIMDATRNAGDLSASPAGRQVHERLTKLEANTELQGSFIDQLRGMGTAMRFVIGTSVISLVTCIVALAKAFSL